jgi:hypothetical protein
MSGGGPEWVSVTAIDVVIHADTGPVRARCQIGIVRTPDGQSLIASRILAPGRDWFILPPQSAALAIGALRQALLEEGLWP